MSAIAALSLVCRRLSLSLGRASLSRLRDARSPSQLSPLLHPRSTHAPCRGSWHAHARSCFPSPNPHQDTLRCARPCPLLSTRGIDGWTAREAAGDGRAPPHIRFLAHHAAESAFQRMRMLRLAPVRTPRPWRDRSARPNRRRRRRRWRPRPSRAAHDLAAEDEVRDRVPDAQGRHKGRARQADRLPRASAKKSCRRPARTSACRQSCGASARSRAGGRC